MLADCTDLNMGECVSAFIRSTQRQVYISALPVETDLYFEKGGGKVTWYLAWNLIQLKDEINNIQK